MRHWSVQGGRPLQGTIEVSGAKNVSLKLIIAALHGHDRTTLQNVPALGDVQVVCEMIRALGGKVESTGSNTLVIDPADLVHGNIPLEWGQPSRASFLFVGPLLARFHEVELPLPGGDRIGRRPLDRHIGGLEAMGAEIRVQGSVIRITTSGLQGTRYRFPKPTHTGTETLILAAVGARGSTILENAALEPEVDDLIAMLNQMGAAIRRVAPRTIRIDGGSRLCGTTYRVMADRNEIVSFACMALATGGSITIQPVDATVLGAFLDLLRGIHAGHSVDGSALRVWREGDLSAADLQTAPHPGIMTDWQPLIVTLLTQARGVSTVHETVFENRFGYVQDLQRMGARIELYNPPVTRPEEVYNFNVEDDQPTFRHAARIQGPVPLRGAEMCVSDVRAGATMLLAALTAEGESSIRGLHHIERGYERLDQRLRSLGARIVVCA
ncbi:MAG: UDP-N-acetylglucosamine 1-carboxyvinyltransferase [Acidobacteria bacterium]|nr:UDP-N-acetylglucosamine 1-carboxyvinyltransferase [Acidobacteriota bacterium]